MVKKKEEPTKIILLESHKIFLSLKFLLQEKEECLTPYGKGLLQGLLDPDCEHKMAVVPRVEHERIVDSLKKPIRKKRVIKPKTKKAWWQLKH